jgi:hypothetical protein
MAHHQIPSASDGETFEGALRVARAQKPPGSSTFPQTPGTHVFQALMIQ